MISRADSSGSRNRLLLFSAAFLFSTGGAAIKACSLSSWQIASFRSGVAAISLYILLPAARRNWTWRTWLVGMTYAATLILFVLANKLTTSANAIFLQSTAPLYLLILAPFLLHEPIRRVDVLIISAVGAGVILLLEGSESIGATTPDPVHGNVLAALSGVTWALTLAGLRWLGKRGANAESATATVIAGNLIACVACLPMAIPVTRASFADIAVLVYLGVFQIGLGYLALTRSIRHIPALEASTLLLVEPVFNPIWTWLVHGERPSLLALLGGGVIILTTLAGAWWQSRADR